MSLNGRLIQSAMISAAVGFASLGPPVHARGLGRCSVHFGSTSCATRLGNQTASIYSDPTSCANIGITHPFSYYSWSGAPTTVACKACGSTTTIPVTVCFNSNPEAYGSSKDPVTSGPLEFTRMAACPGFAAKPIHLVIKAWRLDFSSLRAGSSACAILVDSKLVVANEGTADYVGAGNDAVIVERCNNMSPYGCANQANLGMEAQVLHVPMGTSVTLTPASEGVNAPFGVDCSVPGTGKSGAFVAKWKLPCRADVTCDPDFVVKTEDLFLTVCCAAKLKGLLSACN